jgi:hypothetical protein
LSDYLSPLSLLARLSRCLVKPAKRAERLSFCFATFGGVIPCCFYI